MVTDNRPRLKKVIINDIDVSDYVLRIIVQKEVSSPISSATILLKKSILTLLDVNKDNAIGKLITIYRGVTAPDEEIMFKGEIVNSKQDGNVFELDCLDMYNKAVKAEITKFYDKEVSPEAGIISEIFKTNINDYTDLVADDTSVQYSGTEFVLDKFWCNHADVFERNDVLAETIGWQHYYDEQTDKVRFEPKDYTINEDLVLEVGVNIVEIPEWEYDTDEMINELTVKGSEQEVETTIFASGDGTENQKVVLPYTPISMKVYVGSGAYDPTGTGTKPSNNEGNLKEGGKIGAVSGSYDYEYDDDPNIRTVYFKKTGISQPSFIPPTGTNNIEIQYTKKLPTPVYGYDSQSIAKYGTYRTTHIKEDIKSTSDAEVYLRKTLETYSKPFISTSLKVINATGLKIGAVYRIVDKYNNITENVRVIKITKSWPYRYDEVEVGDKSLREYKFELSVMDRLKRLEELQSSSEDLLTHILPFEKSIGVNAYVESLIRDLSVMKIPQDGLALELLFIGNPDDTSGNNIPVTNYGATLTEDRFGNTNDAYSFDGVDDYIEVANIQSSFNTDYTPITISFWAKSPVSGVSRVFLDTTYDGNLNDKKGWMIFTYWADELRFSYGNGTLFYELPTGMYISSEWRHFTLSIDEDLSYEFYQDGSLKRYGTLSFNILFDDDSTKLWIGKRGDNWGKFNGLIDDVRIYNRALSSEEIALLYNEKVFDLDKDIISHWQFDGNAEDSVGNNNGIVYGAKLTEGYTGVPDSAYEFDGVDDYIDCGTDSSLILGSTFTESVWIYPTHTDTTYHAILGYQPSSSTIYRSPCLYVYQQTKIHAGFGDGTNWNSFTTDSILTNNDWNHLVASFDGTYYKIYVNGVEKYSTDSFAGKTPYPTPVRYVGKVDNYFKGSIDDVRLYNRALTSDEIYKLYLGGQNNRDIFILDHPQFSMLDRQILGDNAGIEAKPHHYDNTNDIFISMEQINLVAGSYTILKILDSTEEYTAFNLKLGATTGTFNIEYSTDNGTTYSSCSEGVTDNIVFSKLMIKITATTDTTISNNLNESEELLNPAIYVNYY